MVVWGKARRHCQINTRDCRTGSGLASIPVVPAIAAVPVAAAIAAITMQINLILNSDFSKRRHLSAVHLTSCFFRHFKQGAFFAVLEHHRE
jgi:hypothetical protein